jgi:uncharacterized membrane protein
MMRGWMVIAVVLWPAVLSAALIDRLDGHPHVSSDVVYVVASRVCHRIPARSFSTHGEQWPVCARCSGLYLGAPLGAALGLTLVTRRRRSTWFPLLLIAAAPTAITWGLEAAAMLPIGKALRMVAALPLGAAVVVVLLDVVSSRRDWPRVNVAARRPQSQGRPHCRSSSLRGWCQAPVTCCSGRWARARCSS